MNYNLDCSNFDFRHFWHVIFFFVAVEGAIRMFLSRKGFSKEDSTILEQSVAYGITVDDISKTLNKFGNVTTTNKEDARLSVYTMLLKGKFSFC